MNFPIGPNEEERLKTLLDTGILDTGPLPALEGICSEAKTYFGVSACAVTLIGRDTQWIKVAQGMPPGKTPRSVAFCNFTILSDEVFVVEDTLLDGRFRNHPAVTGEPFIRFYAGAPLIYLSNIRLGAFCLIDSKPRPFSRGDKAELLYFAEKAVAEIAAQELEGP